MVLTRFTQGVADAICTRVASGESLSSICGPDRPRSFPDQVGVQRWLAEEPGFARRMEMAREALAEFYVEQMLKIADGEDSQAKDARDKTRIETRKWLVAKLSPRRYGDKPVVAAAPEAAPVEFLDDRTAAAQIAAILESARLEIELGEG